MIVDSSAIVAIVFKEPGWETLFDLLQASTTSGIAAPTLVETGIVLTARLQRDALPLLSRLAQELGLETIPFGDRHWQTAVEAYERFGKGRHRAALNFGDCMAYATAHLAEEPLLYVGDDFAATDIGAAVGR
jgi:ribonuclease VapC